MKASAASERNAVTPHSGVQRPPAAKTSDTSPDAGADGSCPVASSRSVALPAASGKARKAQPAKPAAKLAATASAMPHGAESAPELPEQPTGAEPADATPSRPQLAADVKAADVKALAIKPRETQQAHDTTTSGANPAETKPQDTKILDVKTAEPKIADTRPLNGTSAPRPAVAIRLSAKEENFVEGDYVVYPTHGVGKVEKIAIEDIAGHRLELIHITFEENRMTLRVPVAKARTAGLRKLATQAKFDEALTVLRGRARIKRTMWSRRAQEYEAKINSGDPIAIAEVVRDLHRNSGQPDQSFSERQIYESAMDRLAAELAALDATDKATAAAKLVNFLKAA
jgi:CarD family transcriptional regulator